MSEEKQQQNKAAMQYNTVLCTGRILKLTLKKKWFEMIASGEKKEEYREIKDYWTTRLEDSPLAPFVLNMKKFDKVLFKNGYSKNAPTLIVECLGLDCDYSKPEWCDGINDMFYVIKLGAVLYDSTKVKPCA